MTPFPTPRNPNGPIVVVGSLNMDLVMRIARVPGAGETLAGHDFRSLPGGKGANQAVACARLGGKVAMIGQVGADPHGSSLRQGLEADGIDIGLVRQTSVAETGVAMILVEDSGQNRILLAPGANGALVPADIEAAAGAIRGAALLITQLEVPIPVVTIDNPLLIPLIIDGGPTGHAQPTTIVDLSLGPGRWEILREGAIPTHEIVMVLQR